MSASGHDAELDALRAVCGRSAPPHGWSFLMADADAIHVRNERSRRRVRLDPWHVCLWLLVAELSDASDRDFASMFLELVPGKRVQPASSLRSHARARARALAQMQPKGEWRWEEDPVEVSYVGPLCVPHDGADGYRREHRGRLIWEESEPAPERRAELAQAARSWSEHGIVARDWRLAGSLGRCPCAPVIVAAPALGEWVLAFTEGRAPRRDWYREMAASHAELARFSSRAVP